MCVLRNIGNKIVGRWIGISLYLVLELRVVYFDFIWKVMENYESFIIGGWNCGSSILERLFY